MTQRKFPSLRRRKQSVRINLNGSFPKLLQKSNAQNPRYFFGGRAVVFFTTTERRNVIATKEAICTDEFKRLICEAQIASKIPTYKPTLFFRNDVAVVRNDAAEVPVIATEEAICEDKFKRLISKTASKIQRTKSAVFFRWTSRRIFHNDGAAERHC